MSGGGLGTGAGGLLGTLAGVALAPETGGLSMLIPAATGAAGAELGNAVTGSAQNPLMAALMGGIGGGLGGASSLGSELGISDSAGLFGDTGAMSASDAGMTAGNALFPDGVSGAGSGIASADPTVSMAGEPMASAGSAGTDNLVNNFASQQAAHGASGAGASSMLGNIGNWASKNPLPAALLGETALTGAQSLLPKPSVNVGQTSAQVRATDPSFNATLPQYKMQNTATPYQGNWYTYGQQPEAAMYNAQPVPQAQGGLIKGYAMGGTVSPGNRVNPLAGVMPRLSTALRSNAPPMHGSRFPMAHGYAAGGPVMPGAMPPQAAPQQQPNPLQLAAVRKMGMAIGQHLKAHGYDPNKTPAGPVHGKGGGQDDVVPARLSDGEFVVPADIVAHLGDGSSTQGGKKLQTMLHNVRAQKTSHGSKFPPKAKANPLSYIGAS